MKFSIKILTLFLVLLISACGGKEEKEKDPIKLTDHQQEETKQAVENAVEKATETPDMENKGIGPVTELDLPETIDQEMAARGKATFDQMCTACHKTDQKFIGPALAGIMERRSPEWVMNMILNPTEMVQKDPIAKQLLADHNGSPMADQNLTEEQARAVVEYFRTLK